MEKHIPTLILLCGLPATGKTTYARQLETGGNIIRLSSDDWMVPLFGQHMPRDVFDSRLAIVKELQWELATKLLRADLDVVLDNGFWTKAERDDYKGRARLLGVETRLIYFSLPKEEIVKRLQKRNSNLSETTFEIDENALELFMEKFEIPFNEDFIPYSSQVSDSLVLPPTTPFK